ncbi:Glucose oxidase [Penicillium ucsense]|uniref:glucose oxidase n=1 Tax=Penicillium ucsense TaxID=2839758 RepID=A0A8J8VZR3_9EURO|nr:Glucose oxidase [Penicillium ucsense]KAF7733001.1 Glucose oxidase [Penicillium ucsense]
MKTQLSTIASLAYCLGSVHAAPHANMPTYDFVIIGGGTSGLVVANRLSENKDITVAVIEAGDSVFSNPNVTNVNGYGRAFGTNIDWAYPTEPQIYAGGGRQIMRAGKAIGGTSTINGMAYTRAQDVQIDAWEQVGNDGWNWKSLFPYFTKSEEFQIPTRNQISRGADYYITYHGENGNLKVGWPSLITNRTLLPLLDETFNQLGVPFNRDVNGGRMVGLTSHPDTVDSTENIREDAARAYYWPYQNRSNLKILTNTFANKIIWSNDTRSEATAVGVEVKNSRGVQTIYASKEVILAAGAVKSPAILELSGVGNPDILRKYNITVKVNIPTVGENLQDQTNNGINYQGLEFWLGSPTFSVLPSANQLYGSNVSNVAAYVKSSMTEYAKVVANSSNGAVSEANLLEAFQVQHDLIFKSQVPYAEIVLLPILDSFSAEYWPLLPFARGNVHIKSADPSATPAINPNFFQFSQDLDAQVDVAKFIRKAFSTNPLNDLVGDEFAPGLDNLPNDAPASEWNDWVKSNYRTNYHPVGTASMLPREKGGVVSSTLKVYGTKNVRVVDASIIPFQVCGHLTATIYAVAEKVSDAIKNRYRI